MNSSFLFSFFLSLLVLLGSKKTLVNSHAVDKSTPLLPWGEINVLIVTDVHAWVGGHNTGHKEPQLDADYGAVVSFHSHLARYAQSQGLPLFFVMNGDFMDGTGLAAQHPPIQLMEILSHMPWDAVNIGNHDLYKNSTVQGMLDTAHHGIVPAFGEKYLTSNVLLADTNQPIGNRYIVLESTNDDGTTTRLLTFGFLYNMPDACAMARVEKVHAVLESDWFQESLREPNLDGVLVLAHMDVQDPLVFVIHKAIRAVLGPSFPVQFVTGHTHYRGFHQLDDSSTSVEAGRYLDTVGFLSFPKAHTLAAASATTNRQELFQHVFLNANLDTLSKHLPASEQSSDGDFFTKQGRDLQQLIGRLREELGLMKVLGCLDKTLYHRRGLKEPQSMWELYRTKVVPEILFEQSEDDDDSIKTKVMFQDNGGFRYDLIAGPIYYDDLVAISPFNDTIYKIADGLTGLQLKQILGHDPREELATAKSLGRSYLPETIVTLDEFVDDQEYELYTIDFDLKRWSSRVAHVTGVAPQPTLVPDWTINSLWEKYVELYLSEGCPPVQESHERGNKTTTLVVGVVVSAAIFGLVCWCRRRQATEGVSADNDEPYCTTTTTTIPTIAVVAAVRRDDDDDEYDDDDKEEEGLALL